MFKGGLEIWVSLYWRNQTLHYICSKFSNSDWASYQTINWTVMDSSAKNSVLFKTITFVEFRADQRDKVVAILFSTWEVAGSFPGQSWLWGSLCTSQKSSGNGASTLAFKPMGRVNQSPKERVPVAVALQNGDLSPQKNKNLFFFLSNFNAVIENKKYKTVNCPIKPEIL